MGRRRGGVERTYGSATYETDRKFVEVLKKRLLENFG